MGRHRWSGDGGNEAAIACGDIGGSVIATDDEHELAIGLDEQNASERMEVALLRDGRDGGTTVTIYLTTAGMAVASATPSDIRRAGDPYSRTFEEMGTFMNRCRLHQGMPGSIAVVETPDAG